MTPMPRDLARKQPAEVVATRPLPDTIDGEVVPRRPTDSKTSHVVMWIVLLLLAAGFAGLLLSLMSQQAI